MVDIEKALTGAAESSKNVPPSELIQKLMSERPSEILPFPRNDPNGKPLFSYRMCILSQQQLDGCLVDAERYARAQFKDKKQPNDAELGAVRGEAWTEVFNNAKIVEVLLRACCECERGDSERYRPLFLGGSQIRSLLTTDELAALFNAYQNTQFKYGPLWRLLSAEEVDSIVDRIEGGLDLNPLLHWEPGQLLVLVASLAAQNRNWKIATGSSGGPVENGTNETSIPTDGENENQ